MKTHHRATRSDARRCAGIFITDAVIGLAVLAVLFTITAVTLGHDYRAQRAAVDHRRLTTAAEQAMLALQLGYPPDDAARDAAAPARSAGHTLALAFDRLPDGEPPDGQVWVRVTATHNGQSVELIGLAPAQTAERFPVSDAPGPAPPGESP